MKNPFFFRSSCSPSFACPRPFFTWHLPLTHTHRHTPDRKQTPPADHLHAYKGPQMQWMCRQLLPAVSLLLPGGREGVRENMTKHQIRGGSRTCTPRPRARPCRLDKKGRSLPLRRIFLLFFSHYSKEGKTFLPSRLLEMSKFLLLLETAGRSADQGLGVLPPAVSPAQFGSPRPDLAAAAGTLNRRSYIVILEQKVRRPEQVGRRGEEEEKKKSFKLFRRRNQEEVR